MLNMGPSYERRFAMSSPESEKPSNSDVDKLPPPTPRKTNPGPTPTNSQMDGNPNDVATDNDLLSPKDDTPWFLEKKKGPKPS